MVLALSKRSHRERPVFGPRSAVSAEKRATLLAPIALYPDPCIAVLGAATFPDQIAARCRWLQQNRSPGATLMQAVDKQPWIL